MSVLIMLSSNNVIDKIEKLIQSNTSFRVSIEGEIKQKFFCKYFQSYINAIKHQQEISFWVNIFAAFLFGDLVSVVYDLQSKKTNYNIFLDCNNHSLIFKSLTDVGDKGTGDNDKPTNP